VRGLVTAGFNDCEVARATGIPRRTVLDWRHGRVPGATPRRRSVPICHVCANEEPRFPAGQYAYVLGLYLGDGCISATERTHKIRVALDSRYPGIVRACAEALEGLVPPKRAWCGRRRRSHCVDVTMYWNHWPCLFPQHGPGRKHEREIALVSWQQGIVSLNRKEFLRGLFHSDGCRVVADDRGVPSVRTTSQTGLRTSRRSIATRSIL